jgi:hypothetical protein
MLKSIILNFLNLALNYVKKRCSWSIVFMLGALVSYLVPTTASAQVPFTNTPNGCLAGFAFSLSYSSSVAPPYRQVANAIPNANGDFTITGIVPQTDPGSYYFSPSQVLSVNINQKQILIDSNGTLKGNVKCTKSPNSSSVNSEFSVTQNPLPVSSLIPECSAVNVNQLCGQWFKFSPSYYPLPDPGYSAATRTSYPQVPQCNAMTGLTPAVVTSGPNSGCFRRFWVLRVAAPQPPVQWVPRLKLNTWVLNATPQNLTLGDQIAN